MAKRPISEDVPRLREAIRRLLVLPVQKNDFVFVPMPVRDALQAAYLATDPDRADGSPKRSDGQ